MSWKFPPWSILPGEFPPGSGLGFGLGLGSGEFDRGEFTGGDRPGWNLPSTIFQSVRTNRVKQFGEFILFSIDFKRVFWSSNEATEAEYDLIKALGIHIEREKKFSVRPAEKCFLQPLARKQKYFLALFVPWASVERNS